VHATAFRSGRSSKSGDGISGYEQDGKQRNDFLSLFYFLFLVLDAALLIASVIVSIILFQSGSRCTRASSGSRARTGAT
jgi:hypothetical protein